MGILDAPGTSPAKLRTVTGAAALSGVILDPATDATSMPSPPTVTLTGPSNTPPTAGYDQVLPFNTPQVSLLGAVLSDIVVSSQSYKGNDVNAPGQLPQQPMAAEFTLFGDRVAIKFPNRAAGSSGVRVLVDGLLAGSITTAVGSSGGSPFWCEVVFASTGLRTIRVEYSQAQFGGVAVPTAAVVAPVRARRPRCAFLGDSYTAGANSVANPQLLATLTGRAMNWEIARMGQGGTGYVKTNGSLEAFGGTTRMARLASFDPEWAIILGSINDDDQSSSAVGAAAAACYAAIATQSPRTRIIVVGPQVLVSATPAGRLANRDAIKAAAAAAPNVVAFRDPIAEAWITSSDTSLIDVDNTHPTVAGHAVWASKLTRSLMRAVG